MAKLRFQFDEHIANAIATGLRTRGIDVLTPSEAGLRTRPDTDVLAFAAESGRVLVTHDHGFLKMARQGRAHAGIAYIVTSKAERSVRFSEALSRCMRYSKTLT